MKTRGELKEENKGGVEDKDIDIKYSKGGVRVGGGRSGGEGWRRGSRSTIEGGDRGQGGG